jgi:hypothetical protein
VGNACPAPRRRQAGRTRRRAPCSACPPCGRSREAPRPPGSCPNPLTGRSSPPTPSCSWGELAPSHLRQCRRTLLTGGRTGGSLSGHRRGISKFEGLAPNCGRVLGPRAGGLARAALGWAHRTPPKTEPPLRWPNHRLQAAALPAPPGRPHGHHLRPAHDRPRGGPRDRRAQAPAQVARPRALRRRAFHRRAARGERRRRRARPRAGRLGAPTPTGPGGSDGDLRRVPDAAGKGAAGSEIPRARGDKTELFATHATGWSVSWPAASPAIAIWPRRPVRLPGSSCDESGSLRNTEGRRRPAPPLSRAPHRSSAALRIDVGRLRGPDILTRRPGCISLQYRKAIASNAYGSGR